MSRIKIGTTVIDFPNSGTDANWAPAVDAFAIAVEKNFASVITAFDVSPRVEYLQYDANTNLEVPSASFNHLSVRGFTFNYSIYRTNNVLTISEIGVVLGHYDPANGWNLSHTFSGQRQSDGEQYHTFAMSGDQLTLTTVAIGGSYDSSKSEISYSAKALLINNPS